MRKVYLVDLYRKDGSYLLTSNLVFTSKAAAKRYAEDCEHKTQIKVAELISLSDF